MTTVGTVSDHSNNSAQNHSSSTATIDYSSDTTNTRPTDSRSGFSDRSSNGSSAFFSQQQLSQLLRYAGTCAHNSQGIAILKWLIKQGATYPETLIYTAEDGRSHYWMQVIDP